MPLPLLGWLVWILRRILPGLIGILLALVLSGLIGILLALALLPGLILSALPLPALLPLLALPALALLTLPALSSVFVHIRLRHARTFRARVSVQHFLVIDRRLLHILRPAVRLRQIIDGVPILIGLVHVGHLAELLYRLVIVPSRIGGIALLVNRFRLWG